MSRESISNPGFYPVLLAIIIDAMGFGLVYPVMTSMFSVIHNNPFFPDNISSHLRHFYLGLGFLLYPAAMFFGASFLGDLSDSWGRRRVLLICVFGLILSYAMMALGVFWGSLIWLYIGRALSGLMAGSSPIAQAAVADMSTATNKAHNMGLMTLALSVGIVIGPLVGGITSDHSLAKIFNYTTPFIISAILSFICFIWLFFCYLKRHIKFQDK